MNPLILEVTSKSVPENDDVFGGCSPTIKWEGSYSLYVMATAVLTSRFPLFFVLMVVSLYMSGFYLYAYTSIFASCTGLPAPLDVCRRRVVRKSTTMKGFSASSLSHLRRGSDYSPLDMLHSSECFIIFQKESCHLISCKEI